MNLVPNSALLLDKWGLSNQRVLLSSPRAVRRSTSPISDLGCLELAGVMIPRGPFAKTLVEGLKVTLGKEICALSSRS